MFSERLARARKAAGLSMAALGGQVGISANAVKKYEHGEAMPSSSNLLNLAKALGVRTEYFFRTSKIELAGVEYRKRANTSKKLLNRIDGDVTDQAERWYELLELYPDSVKPIPDFSLPTDLPEVISTFDQVEAVAQQIRMAWGLGVAPIHDMIDTLESKGIMVIVTRIETTKKFDGLAGAIGSIPVIVISTDQPGDRQRSTLAHELGHRVLHGRLSEALNEEKACQRFSGAFLLPQAALVEHLGTNRRGLEEQELYMLKHEYGISMNAILYRAGQCNIITQAMQKAWYFRFSKAGWRTLEPGDPYPQETTYLYKQLVYRALAEGYMGESKAAELLGISLARFHKERKLEVVSAASDQ